MAGSKMHDDEVGTDAGLVARLLAAQFPKWANLPIEPVPSAGTDNALYRLGSNMAVRMPRIDWAVNAVDREHQWLPKIAPFLPLAIPTPLGQGEPGEGYPYPWSVYPWLEGENPAVGQLADPDGLATDLARFVHALQSVDATGGPRGSRGVPLEQRESPTRAAIRVLQGTVDTTAVTMAWDAALEVPAWSGPPVWAHGDLSPGNLLMINGRLTAVIDFGTLGVGDPAVDLIVAWNLLPVASREVYRSALNVEDATWLRGRGWALSIALIQLPYYHHKNPVLADTARYVIAEVLADVQRTG
jgi:aminoglycoside phosphotransferase (APT) family kinase protein